MKLNQLGRNMTSIDTGKTEIFFSYETPVAQYNHATKQLARTSTFWSRTTSKHISKFIGLKRPESVFLVEQSVLDTWSK